ncbi:hypothetical protein FQR65_LT09136 [Abscondita terminalis]|nr:hypothetical protein FQR65_LT09136 [Abscondita terminalis]
MFVVDESKLYFISINNEVQEAIKLIQVYHKTDESVSNNDHKIYLRRLKSKFSNINLKSSNKNYMIQENFDMPDITLQPLQYNKKGLSLLNIISNNSVNNKNSDDSDLDTVLITEPQDDVNYTKNKVKPIKPHFIQEVLDLLDDENENMGFNSCSYMVCKVAKVCSSEEPEKPDVSYHVATHCIQASQDLSYPSQIVNSNFCQLPSIQVVYERDNRRGIFDNIPESWQPSYMYLPVYENCPCCGQQNCCNNQNYSYFYDTAIPMHESMYAINYEPTSYICPQCGEQHLYESQHSLCTFANLATQSNTSNFGYQGIAQTSSNFVGSKITNNSLCSVCSRLSTKYLKSMATSPIDVAVLKANNKPALMTGRHNTAVQPNNISINIDLSNPPESDDSVDRKPRNGKNSNPDYINPNGRIQTNLDLIAPRPRKVCVEKPTPRHTIQPQHPNATDSYTNPNLTGICLESAPIVDCSTSSSDSFSSRPTKVCLPKHHFSQASKIPVKSTGKRPIQNTSGKRTCDVSLDPRSPRSLKNYLKPATDLKHTCNVSLDPISSKPVKNSSNFESRKSVDTTCRNSANKAIITKPLHSPKRLPSTVDVSEIYLKSTGTSPMDLTSLKHKCITAPKSGNNTFRPVPSKSAKVCAKTSPINVISSDNNNSKPPKTPITRISETADISLCSELSEPMMSISLNSVCKPLQSNKSTCACLNSNNKKTDTANLNSTVSVDLNSALQAAMVIEPRKKKGTCKCIDAKPTVSSKTTSVKTEDNPCFSSVCHTSEISDSVKRCNKKSDKVKELLNEIANTSYLPWKKNQAETNKIVKFDCSEKSLQTGSSIKMKNETNKLDLDHECKECSLLKDSIVSLIQAVFGIATKPKPCHQQSNVADIASKVCKKSCSSCACRQKKKKANKALEESFKLNDIIQKAKNKKFGEFKEVCHRIQGLDKVLQDTLLEPYLEYLLDEKMSLHKKKRKVCNLCGGYQHSVVSCHYENNPVICSLAKHLKKDQLFDKNVTDYLKSLEAKSFCNEEYDLDL